MIKDAKKESVRRLKIIEGHVRKINEMVINGEYCIDILHQSRAVQSALKKVDQIFVMNVIKLDIAVVLQFLKSWK